MSVYFENNENFDKIEMSIPPARVVVINQTLPEYTYIYEVEYNGKTSILYEGSDYWMQKYIDHNYTEIRFVAGLENTKIRIYYEIKNQYGCRHEYKLYLGFTERYEYCAKCDHKKE